MQLCFVRGGICDFSGKRALAGKHREHIYLIEYRMRVHG